MSVNKARKTGLFTGTLRLFCPEEATVDVHSLSFGPLSPLRTDQTFYYYGAGRITGLVRLEQRGYPKWKRGPIKNIRVFKVLELVLKWNLDSISTDQRI